MRSKRVKKRTVQNDPIYKSKTVTRMVNVIMRNGKKSLAEGFLYDVLFRLSEDRKEALSTFEQAVKNVMPVQEVRSRRVGGATYQVPMPLKHDRSEALAIRWIVNCARSKKGKSISDRLYDELKSAYQGVGDAVKKRDDTHRMAEANRAFSHFARF